MVEIQRCLNYAGIFFYRIGSRLPLAGHCKSLYFSLRPSGWQESELLFFAGTHLELANDLEYNYTRCGLLRLKLFSLRVSTN